MVVINFMSIPLCFCWEVGIAKAAFRSIVKPMVPVIHMITAVLLVVKVIVTGVALELRPTMARGIAMLVSSPPPSVKHAPACSTGRHGCNKWASCTTRSRSLEQGSELVETTRRAAPLGRRKKELAKISGRRTLIGTPRGVVEDYALGKYWHRTRCDVHLKSTSFLPRTLISPRNECLVHTQKANNALTESETRYPLASTLSRINRFSLAEATVSRCS